MSESKHTPGPWEWYRLDASMMQLESKSPGVECPEMSPVLAVRRCQACAERNTRCLDPSDADARLIAAACNSYDKHCGPRAVACAEADLLGELLEALRELSEPPPDSEDQIYLTGDYMTGLHCGVEDRDIIDRYEAAEYGFEEGVDRALLWVQGIARAAISKATGESEE